MSHASSFFSVFEESVAWVKRQPLDCWFDETTTSTNDVAKTESIRIAHETPKVYLADTQSAGRGRGQRNWQNPLAGHGFIGSWSVGLEATPKSITAPVVGLGVYRALTETFPTLAFSIKAPNDIYLNDRKISGILVETISCGKNFRLIVGIGINVHSHPTNVPGAGALGNDFSVSPEIWHQFLDRLHAEVMSSAKSCQESDLTEAQRERLLDALNRFPLLTERYTAVSPHGDLITSSRTVSWKEL